MSLECADGTFGYVATMGVGGYYLVRGCPDVGDMLAVFLACFVIELQSDLQIGSQTVIPITV